MDVREKILRAAAQRFLGMGFSSQSLDELCRSLGISKKTLYQEFSSREQLNKDVVVWFFDRIESQIKPFLRESEDWSFTRRLRGYLEIIKRNVSGINLPALNLLKDRDPALWELIFSIRARIMNETLTTILKPARQRNQIRQDIPLDFQYSFIVSVLNSFVLPEPIIHLGVNTDQFLTYTADTIVRGLTGGPDDED